MVQLELGLKAERANAAMLGFAARKAELPELPSRLKYRMTVADVVTALTTRDHIEAVRRWAEATWQDWADQHDFIRSWAARL